MPTAYDKSLVEQILSLPEAPLLVEELQKTLREEEVRRKKFYNTILSEENKVEFINGEIIIQSPVKKEHNEYSGLLYQLLNIYVTKHDLGFVGVEKIMISLTRNDYEPDVCFFRKETSKHFKKDQSLFRPPDLAVEFISKKTEFRDRGIKFEDYQNHAVQEYWIIAPDKKNVEQYLLEEGAYTLIKKTDSGEITCSVIPGLTIPVASIFDKLINLEVISKILTN